jgi:hypothetical protein
MGDPEAILVAAQAVSSVLETHDGDFTRLEMIEALRLVADRLEVAARGKPRKPSLRLVEAV